MADAAKLKALVDQGEDYQDAPQEAPYEPPDPEEEMSEEAQKQRKLNPQVGYMELDEPAGAFSCGTCIYAVPADDDGAASCMQELVRANVSETNGCCNLFHPAEASIVFPPQAGGAGEEHEDEEDHDEEGEEYEADDEGTGAEDDEE